MVSRRNFLIGGGIVGGGLILGLSLLPEHRRDSAAKYVIDNENESLLTTWLKIDKDNIITVYVPHSEMGQGVQTALPMMLAEELEADWNLVRMERAPGETEFANGTLAKGFLVGGMGVSIPIALDGIANYSTMALAELVNLQITGGSTAIRFSGHYGMRIQGAAAKEMLLQAAANIWQVPLSELKAENSNIIHPKSNRTATYGELAQQASLMEIPSNPTLKDRSDYKIVGTSKPRFDIPAKIDGSLLYGADINLPDMKIAAVKTSPVFGAEVASYDDSKVSQMSGVRKVVKLPGAIAVVADGFWQAKQAVDELPVEFTETEYSHLNSNEIYQQYSDDLDKVDETGADDVIAGNAPAVLAGSIRTIKSEYRVPFLAHSAMEPVNSTVWLKDDGSVEFWAGLQDALTAKAMLSELLQIPMDKVTAHHTAMGGAFGRRAATLNFLEQNALIAKDMKVPIKLIWTREEDMQQDYYRPAITSRFEAALDDNNEPVAWVNTYIGKNEPPEAAHIPYAIENQQIRFVDSKTPIPFGPWRSVAHSQHGFFTESFVDELANAANKDTYQFRRDLLKHSPRHLKVLDMVAQKADWTSKLPESWGRGIALQTSFQSVVAQVVEVSINNGKVKPERVVCVIDCGHAINPDNVTSQMESGIIYGMTAALYGDISIKDGRVQQSNFHDYEMLRMSESPVIETYIIESDAPLGGVGEPGTPAIAPALANAVYDATGNRVRTLPIKHYDFTYKPEAEQA